MGLKSIRDAAITRLGILLPTYVNLKNAFDIDKNSKRALAKGYAVKWGQSVPATTATRKIAQSAPLIISITNSLPKREADDIMDSTGDLYDDIDTVVESFPNDTFLGLIGEIRGILVADIGQAEIISKGEAVQIDIIFNINHVQNINYS